MKKRGKTSRSEAATRSKSKTGSKTTSKRKSERKGPSRTKPGKPGVTRAGYELLISADHFGDSLVFEFVRKTGTATQKLGLVLAEFRLDNNTDRATALSAKYFNAANPNNPNLVSEIRLSAMPVAGDARNFGISISVAVDGLARNDIFRVMSSPPQKDSGPAQVAPPYNPNSNAHVYLRNPKTPTAPPLAAITSGGVPLSWKEFVLTNVP
jgi:hypothetical protein